MVIWCVFSNCIFGWPSKESLFLLTLHHTSGAFFLVIMVD